MAAIALAGNMIGVGGSPASGCKLSSVIRNTSTPSPLYSDVGLTTPTTNPYVGDADGRLDFYFSSLIQYTWTVRTSDDATIIWQADIVGGVVTVTYADGILIHSTWAPPLATALGSRWASAFGAPFPTFEPVLLADGSDESATIQAQLTAANTAGGGRVVINGPARTIRCKNLLIYSNTTLEIDDSVTLKLPDSAGNTDRIIANANTGTFTDEDVTVLGGVFDGNDQGLGGAQARFTGLVEFGRVTNLIFKSKVQNTGYSGFAASALRNPIIDIKAVSCGFDGATANGGPAVLITNASGDQTVGGVIKYYAESCRWAAASINAIGGTRIIPRWKNCKEAGLFTPYAPNINTLACDFSIDEIQGDGITEHDISGSGMELGGRGISIGSGTIKNSDHNVIAFTDVQDVTFAGAITGENWNQDTQGSSPQGAGVAVISGSASPNQPKNINVTGVSLIDKSTNSTVTISQASPAVITWATHGLQPGDMVKFTTGGSLPTGLTVGTAYFILEDGFTLGSFRVSATRGGSAVNTSSAGSGTHTCTKATTGYSFVGIGGSGDAATDVRFHHNDFGRASVSVPVLTTKFGSGCSATNNTSVSDYIFRDTIAGATTINVGSDSDQIDIDISGTSFTCTSLGGAGGGTVRRLYFTGSGGVLTHGANLVLPGAANITLWAGDMVEFVVLASGAWKCTSIQRANAQAPVERRYTANDTWNKPTGLLYVIAEVVGGGGAGGSCEAGGASTTAAGGGGGGGGYSRKKVLAASLGSSETVTVGAAGAAAASGNNNGGAGGTTSFGAHLQATGGSGGTGSAAATQTSATGRVGGVGSSGDINSQGGTGQNSAALQGVFVSSGGGGSSFYGGGGTGRATTGAGNAGGPYGGGGGGGAAGASGAAQVGGAGAAGLVIVTEYYQ